MYPLGEPLPRRRREGAQKRTDSEELVRRAHVGQRVDDRTCLESVVTEVVVDNLHLLVSQLAEREKLDRLRVAANLLIARRAASGPRETDGCAPGE